MRWKQGRRSTNVEDRRGRGVSRGVAIGGGGLGLLVVVVIALLLGVDPTQLLTDVSSTQVDSSQSSAPPPPGQDEASDFVSVVLADTEDTWKPLFRDMGKTYVEPKLVLFTGEVRSACGLADAAVGPFYCPGDQKVYLDMSFYADLKNRFKAPGDFAQAYIIGHEVGHHVQTLLGISGDLHQEKAGKSKAMQNEISVRQELQADCFAGVWAHHASRVRNLLEAGDIEEGLGAATAIGDDRLQMQARGYVTPDSFTHGTSAQRVKWFKIGLETGEVKACDTYSGGI